MPTPSLPSILDLIPSEDGPEAGLSLPPALSPPPMPPVRPPAREPAGRPAPVAPEEWGEAQGDGSWEDEVEEGLGGLTYDPMNPPPAVVEAQERMLGIADQRAARARLLSPLELLAQAQLVAQQALLGLQDRNGTLKSNTDPLRVTQAISTCKAFIDMLFKNEDKITHWRNIDEYQRAVQRVLIAHPDAKKLLEMLEAELEAVER